MQVLILFLSLLFILAYFSIEKKNLREHAGICDLSLYKASDPCRQGLKSQQHNSETNFYLSALLSDFWTNSKVYFSVGYVDLLEVSSLFLLRNLNDLGKENSLCISSIKAMQLSDLEELIMYFIFTNPSEISS